MYANRTGDICQYLGKTDSTLYGYRMPIANEFPHVLNADGEPEREVWDATNTTTPTEAGWLKGDGSFVHTPSAMYADGRADFLSSDNGAGIKLGSVSHPSTGLVLPASGIIYNGNNYIGSAGGGWSASPRGTREIWILNFNNTSVGFSNTPVYVSLPVRCIRKEPGEP
jgi:hypothetical protein